jgi:hypothetical protein
MRAYLGYRDMAQRSYLVNVMGMRMQYLRDTVSSVEGMKRYATGLVDV